MTGDEHTPTSAAVRVGEWLFRDRTTGRITIAQRPNAPLLVFLGASAGRWVLGPSGSARTALTATATASLVVWSLDEVVRGVNPWRRLLGASALMALVVAARR